MNDANISGQFVSAEKIDTEKLGYRVIVWEDSVQRVFAVWSPHAERVPSLTTEHYISADCWINGRKSRDGRVFNDLTLRAWKVTKVVEEEAPLPPDESGF